MSLLPKFQRHDTVQQADHHIHYHVLEFCLRRDGGFDYLCEDNLWQAHRYVQEDHLHWLPEEVLSLVSRVIPRT